MGILNEVNQKAIELENLKQKAILEILNQCKKYENKAVKFISKKPRIFIINFSDLQDNWSPYYYDYEFQFKCILYIFKHTNADNLINKWEQIKKDGICQMIEKDYITDDNKFQAFTKKISEDFYRSSYVKITLNPNVIGFMDKILIGQ